MDLPAIDLERFEAGESVSWPVAVRIAEIETHQDDSEFLIHRGYPVAHIRMRNNALGSNVFTARAGTRARHHVPILEAISARGKRRLHRIEVAADLQSRRIKLRDTDEVDARHLL